MLDDLRKAIITGALAPDTVEGDRLACLAFNLNVDSPTRLRFTKLVILSTSTCYCSLVDARSTMRAARAAW